MHSVRSEPPTGSHAERQRQLRRLLEDARRRGNKEDERLVLAWVDEFVSRAHLRAEDREVKRLRRWLQEAA